VAPIFGAATTGLFRTQARATCLASPRVETPGRLNDGHDSGILAEL